MRDYAKVTPQFWIGETGKALRGDIEAQLVAMYLMTSPHSEWTGVFHCPILYIAHETGLPIEGASKALARLIEGGFCMFDAPSDTVFVFNMAKFQIGSVLKPSDKRVKGIQDDVKKWPDGRIKTEFLRLYNALFSLGFDVQEPSPFQAPSKPLRSQEQEQEQEQKDKEKEKTHVVSVAADPPAVVSTLPNCPADRIRELWAEILPELSQPRVWTAVRQKHLQARWRERCKAKLWKTQEDGVRWFESIFRHLAKSDFLMGRTPPKPGHESWQFSLPWLLEPEHFAKAIEGCYHREIA